MGCCDCQGFGAVVTATYPGESLYHGMSGQYDQLVPLVWPRSDRAGLSGPVPFYPHRVPSFRGMGAGRTAGQTNYWPTGIHRRYTAPGMPQMAGLRGLGAIEVGGGWTLADVSSLALLSLTLMTLWGKKR